MMRSLDIEGIAINFTSRILKIIRFMNVHIVIHSTTPDPIHVVLSKGAGMSSELEEGSGRKHNDCALMFLVPGHSVSSSNTGRVEASIRTIYAISMTTRMGTSCPSHNLNTSDRLAEHLQKIWKSYGNIPSRIIVSRSHIIESWNFFW